MPKTRRRIIGGLLAFVVAMTLPGVALGWHQLKPPEGQDVTDCLDTNASPCIEWAKTGGNLSINVDVYLSYMLTDWPNIDLKPDVRNTFAKWNAVAARNPHLQETTSTSNEEIWVTIANLDNNPLIAGYTEITYAGSAPYHIQSARVYLQSLDTWNHSYSVSCANPYLGGTCNVDSRIVTMHEMGHAEGLAHEATNASFAAIMKKDPTGQTQWWPAVDDHHGIIAIYGAYP